METLGIILLAKKSGLIKSSKEFIDSLINANFRIDNKLEGDYLDSHAKLFSLTNDLDFNIEPHLFEAGNDPSGFLEEINKTGIIIYQRN